MLPEGIHELLMAGMGFGQVRVEEEKTQTSRNPFVALVVPGPTAYWPEGSNVKSTRAEETVKAESRAMDVQDGELLSKVVIEQDKISVVGGVVSQTSSGLEQTT